MSTSLAVRLLLSSPGESNDAVILGDIHSADLTGATLRDIRIPCGVAPQPLSYDVMPGRYLVSAWLPSGLVLTENAVAVEGRETQVDFNMTDSPYETHSWQYLMGNIEPDMVYHSPRQAPFTESVASRSMVATLAGPDGAVPRGAVDLTALATWIGDSTPASWSFASMLELAKTPPESPVARLIASGEPVVLPAPYDCGDEVTPLYRFRPNGPVGARGKPLEVGSGPVGERQFLVVEAADSVRLVTLPRPWGDADVEVLVNLRQSPTGSAVSVAVRDPEVGAGLAYMAQGALDMAARLFTDVESMLYSKVENPLAAAAGSYVLIGTDHSESETRWDPWLVRLAERFPWLSDGAILRSVRLLRRRPRDLGWARDGLIEAFDRGIPFYTLGLVWLIEGPSAFPGDPDCARRLDLARQLAWLVDLREPFLILDLRQGRA
ncbi:hypothetical protein [Streptomyces sp. A012304]|uniref:hypothetical protein n=1 Tax=Streptomyces sp. A012304 TaxID=375446 RepID=UPI0022321B2B|nr:hypothetical protein [Streptomyces sp. A012304]GKQ41436.1 hypothetical protein ALMP_79520 [Streptomyces sp. A012304]